MSKKDTAPIYCDNPMTDNLHRSRKILGLRWYGGKRNILNEIHELFPPHHLYVEPCGGGGTVLLNKTISPTEVYNDIYGEVVTFFKMLRDRPQELIQKVSLSPISREEYFEYIFNPEEDPMERSRQFIMAHYYTFLGLTRKTPGRFSLARPPAYADKMRIEESDLWAMAERLKFVVIENRPAEDVVKLYDHKDALFYLDPPYVMESRTGGEGYEYEMYQKDHERLGELLLSCKGKVLISTYENDLYDKMFESWEKVKIKNVSSGARFRTVTEGFGENKYRMEVAYRNYKTGFFHE